MPTSWREKQKAELHEHIYKVSLQLFRSQGYEATTIEMITTQAGVAKGTFFNYFKSKEYVILEWYRHLMLGTLEWAKTQDFDSAQNAILLAVEETARQAESEPRLIAAKVSSSIASTLLGNKEKQFDDQWLRYFEKHIMAGQQRGEIGLEFDARLMASTILAILNGTGYEWKSLGRTFDLRETTRKRVQFVFNATKPSKG
jgi:AcrR family transcriptional regulator